MGLWDQQAGCLLERYEYDAYGTCRVYRGYDAAAEGEVGNVVGASLAVGGGNPIRYGGYYFDDETGLYHVRCRMYSSGLQRWLQRDPAGYVNGPHLYGYVDGNPIGGLDPSGLWGIKIGGVFVGSGQPTYEFVGGEFDHGVYVSGRGMAEVLNAGLNVTGLVEQDYLVNPDYFQYEPIENGWDRAGEIAGGTVFVAGSLAAVLEAAEVAFTPLSRGGMCRVTSWAEDGIVPDLNPGRWVQLGGPTRWNYIKTGLWGPKYVVGLSTTFPWVLQRVPSLPVSLQNAISRMVPVSQLTWPGIFEFWKGVLGQRQIW